MARRRRTGKRKASPLETACMRGDVGKIARLLNQKSIPRRQFPLHAACLAGNVQSAEALKHHFEQYPAQDWLTLVNSKDHNGHVPLAVTEKEDMLKWLLENGARVELGGGQPLLHACGSGNLELMQLILSRVPNQDVAASLVDHIERQQCLRSVCKEGHFEIAKLLLHYGVADWTKEFNWEHMTLFQFALQALPDHLRRQFGAVSSLQEALAFVDIVIEKEALYSQLVDATACKDWERASELLDVDGTLANSLYENNKKPSPLFNAIEANNPEFCKKLLDEYGANVNRTGRHCESPLLKATEKNLLAIFQLLVQVEDVDIHVKHSGDYTPLHRACLVGNLDMVRILLEKGADVDAETDGSNGRCTPLYFACCWEDRERNKPVKVEMIKLLLQHGCKVNVRDFETHYTALHRLAASRRSIYGGVAEVESVKLLLQYGAKVEALDLDDWGEDFSRSALLMAIDIQHYDIAKVLIIQGKANVNSQWPGGNFTALHMICASRFREQAFELARICIEHGAEVDCRTSDYDHGKTPLHFALRKGNFCYASLLLANGADLSQKARDGTSCLDFARESENKVLIACTERTMQLAVACKDKVASDIQSLLLDGEEEYNIFPQVILKPSGLSLLHIVAQLGLLDSAIKLVVKGADINCVSVHDGKTPFDLAVEARHKHVATWLREAIANEETLLGNMARQELNNKLVAILRANKDSPNQISLLCRLITASADVDLKDRLCFDKTPLHIAAATSNVDGAKVLIGHGANVNARDKRLSTPLHGSAWSNSYEVTKLLLENGAEVLLVDEFDISPLHVASKHRHVEISELLLSHGADIQAQAKDGLTPHRVTTMFASIPPYALWENTYKLVDAVRQSQGNALTIDQWTDKDVFPMTKLPQDMSMALSWTEFIAKSVRYVEDCQQGGWETTEEYSRINFLTQTEHLETAGEFLLHFFCQTGNLDMVRYLLEKGANTDIRRDDGMTALALAAKNGFVDIAELLIEHGASLVADNWGNAPLHHASRQGHVTVLELICNHEIAQKKNWLGQTSRDAAIQHRQLFVVSYLDQFM